MLPGVVLTVSCLLSGELLSTAHFFPATVVKLTVPRFVKSIAASKTPLEFQPRKLFVLPTSSSRSG